MKMKLLPRLMVILVISSQVFFAGCVDSEEANTTQAGSSRAPQPSDSGCVDSEEANTTQGLTEAQETYLNAYIDANNKMIEALRHVLRSADYEHAGMPDKKVEELILAKESADSAYASASIMLEYADEAGTSEEERSKGTRMLAESMMGYALHYRSAVDHYIKAHGYTQDALELVEKEYEVEEIPETSDPLSFILGLVNKHVKSERLREEVESKVAKASAELVLACVEIEKSKEYVEGSGEAPGLLEIRKRIPWLEDNVVVVREWEL